jgi:hypothetical protein
MTALAIIASAAALIALALATNASIDVNYDEKGGFRAWVRYGPVRKLLYPQPEKPVDSRKYSKKKQPKAKTAPAGGAASAESKEAENPLDVIRTAASLIGEIKERLHRHSTLIAREVDITVATDDAAKTAIAYGAVCAAVDALFGVCSAEEIRLRTDKIDIKPDFIAGRSSVRLRLTFRMRVIHALGLLTHVLSGFIGDTEKNDSANTDTVKKKRSV